MKSERYFTLFKSHCIYLETDNSITIDDFNYDLKNFSISQIEKIYNLPNGYFKKIIEEHS